MLGWPVTLSCLALEHRGGSTRFQPELTIATLLTLKGYFLARASTVRPFSFVVLTCLEISRT